MTKPWSAEIAAQKMWDDLDLRIPEIETREYFKQHLKAVYDAGFKAGYTAADKDGATTAAEAIQTK